MARALWQDWVHVQWIGWRIDATMHVLVVFLMCDIAVDDATLLRGAARLTLHPTLMQLAIIVQARRGVAGVSAVEMRDQKRRWAIILPESGCD